LRLAAVADLDRSELALDNPERMLYFGSNPSLGFFDLLSQCVALVFQIQRGRTGLEQQPFLNQQLIDDCQDLLGKLVFFQTVAESQNG
jgi:hypothetical protein